MKLRPVDNPVAYLHHPHSKTQECVLIECVDTKRKQPLISIQSIIRPVAT